jgi:hypothetical protein
LAAWRRDHEDDASSESDVERAARDAAATLALIGLAIEERGLRLSDGRVRVFLHAEDVAAVVATAQALSNQCALIGRTVPNLRHDRTAGCPSLLFAAGSFGAPLSRDSRHVCNPGWWSGVSGFDKPLVSSDGESHGFQRRT